MTRNIGLHITRTIPSVPGRTFQVDVVLGVIATVSTFLSKDIVLSVAFFVAFVNWMIIDFVAEPETTLRLVGPTLAVVTVG